MKQWLSNPAVNISLITAIVTAGLAIAKFVIGMFGKSHALIADGVHSIADVLVDLLVLGAAHFGAKQADSNHPYGHGRIETAATFGLAQILILAGIGIIADAIIRLWHHVPPVTPNRYVLWLAFAAILINEGLFRWTLRVARRIHSSLLEANAWHSRSDAAVSVVVLLSIGGALLGFTYLDVIGALLVGILIIKMGLTLAWHSITELVDTGVAETQLTKIRQTISQVAGVQMLHQLRTRTINKKVLIDVHILVAPHLSVSEGHFIGDQVMRTLYESMPEIHDITVHVDPEDDEAEHRSSNLPTREVLLTQLKQCWQNLPGASQIQQVHLDYLAGHIEVSLVLPLALLQNYPAAQLVDDYQNQALQTIDILQTVKVRFL